MNALDILRKAIKARKNVASSIKQIKWDDLPIGNYRVHYMKLTDTNFGPKIHVYLKDKPNYVILPPRVPDKVNQEEMIEELNSHDNLWMKWTGKDKNYFNFLQLDFYRGTYFFYFLVKIILLFFLIKIWISLVYIYIFIKLGDDDGNPLEEESDELGKLPPQSELIEEEGESDEADDEDEEEEEEEVEEEQEDDIASEFETEQIDDDDEEHVFDFDSQVIPIEPVPSGTMKQNVVEFDSQIIPIEPVPSTSLKRKTGEIICGAKRPKSSNVVKFVQRKVVKIPSTTAKKAAPVAVMKAPPVAVMKAPSVAVMKAAGKNPAPRAVVVVKKKTPMAYKKWK